VGKGSDGARDDATTGRPPLTPDAQRLTPADEDPRVHTREYYERLYSLEGTHWWFRGTRAIATAILGARYRGGRELTVLDAGCGTGIVVSQLRRLLPGARVLGLDVSRHALKFCRARGHRLLAAASVTDLPLPDESVDLIVCADVLQHLPRGGDAVALRECRRVLRPGGRLYLRTNTTLGRARTTGDEDYHRYHPDELAACVAAAGLVVEQLSYANALPSLFAAARRRLGRGPVARDAGERDRGLHLRPLPPWLLPLNGALALLLWLEGRYLARPGILWVRRLPFGHSLILLARKPASDG
jgi:SAM-dependent methyltransferase